MMGPAVILIRPVLPIWLIVLVVSLVGVAAWRTYRHCSLTRAQRFGLWGLRMSAVSIIAWLLLQAERRQVRVEREDPVLAIAVDVSASMTDNPSAAKETRRKRARAFLTDGRVRRLVDRYRVFEYQIGAEVSEGLGSGELLFNAPRSHIGSGINRIVERLQTSNVAAIVLLSDGLDQSGERLSPESLGVPIFIPEIEEPFELEPEKSEDWYIADVSYPKMMVVNWKANVDVLIRRRNRAPATFPVHFKQNSRVLRTSMAEFEQGQRFAQISFTVEPTEVGQALYQVEIAPQADAILENNRKDFIIDVTDPKNRVLYLEGVPRWEFKFLKRALLSEKNYQLSAFVRGGDGSFINFDELSGQAGGQTPTLDEENLQQYKVIILGDMPASALTEEDCRQIRAFVDKGGGLLLVGAARSYGPGGLLAAPYIEELVPVVSLRGASMKEGKFTVDLTSAGRSHPALGELPLEAALPPLLSFWSPVKTGEFSTTLIGTADGSPVLVTRRYGQGRVAVLLSDSLWRWQLGAADTGVEKSLYSRFVTQLVFWLAPNEKDVEKSALLQVVVAKSEVELREKVTIGAVYDAGEGEDGVLTCRITTPEGKPLVYPMLATTLGDEVGLTRSMDGFYCFFSPQVTGRYEVKVSTADGTQEVNIVLLAARPEHEKTGAPINRDYLRSLASDTGGAFVQWKQRYSMLKDLPYDAHELRLVREYPIWDRWWWLVILLFLFCGEWWWRRRADLV